MPKKIFFDDKKCQQCGKMFNRTIHKSGRLEGPEDFKIRKFCCSECFHLHYQQENHPLFNPNGHLNQDGYIRLSKNGKRNRIHRFIMEEFIGRKLSKNEHVHHINGDTTDNRIENLQLLTNSEHLKLHYKERKIDTNGCFLKK